MRKRIGTSTRRMAGLAVYVGRRYGRDRASSLAASLSYTALLALVPLMAIALAMLAAFPVFGTVRASLQGWVFTNFVPAIGEVVQEQVSRFIANAGRLSAAGIVGLAVSAIMMLVTIETTLNQVFRVAKPRSALSRVLVYWTVMTLGPLLIGASLSLQGYLTALGHWQFGRTAAATLAAPLPTLLSIAAFTVLFAMVPNRQVRPRDAVVGGSVAGLLFALLRWVFALYVVHSGAYSTIYGAVAAVPIFLFWTYLSWVVVLVGAETTAALPEWRAGMARIERRPPGERRLTLALQVLAALHEAALAGHGAVGRRVLLAATAAPEAELAAVLRRLQGQSYVAPTTRHRVVLGRDLATVTLADLVDALDLGLAVDAGLVAPWRREAEQRLAVARAQTEDALEIPLATLLAPAAPAENRMAAADRNLPNDPHI